MYIIILHINISIIVIIIVIHHILPETARVAQAVCQRLDRD